MSGSIRTSIGKGQVPFYGRKNVTLKGKASKGLIRRLAMSFLFRLIFWGLFLAIGSQTRFGITAMQAKMRELALSLLKNSETRTSTRVKYLLPYGNKYHIL